MYRNRKLCSNREVYVKARKPRRGESEKANFNMRVWLCLRRVFESNANIDIYDSGAQNIRSDRKREKWERYEIELNPLINDGSEANYLKSMTKAYTKGSFFLFFIFNQSSKYGKTRLNLKTPKSKIE